MFVRHFGGEEENLRRLEVRSQRLSRLEVRRQGLRRLEVRRQNLRWLLLHCLCRVAGACKQVGLRRLLPRRARRPHL